MVHFDDRVLVHMKLISYNGIKYRISYRMVNEASGQVCTLAESEHCFLTAQGRPMNLKKSHPAFDAVMAALLDVESV